MDDVSPMVERVARAISAAQHLDDGLWVDYVSAAETALDAMRDPPDALCVPGGLAIEEAMFAENKLVFEGARDCFNAMLDAALAAPGEREDP